ncbi:hypothetical protein ACET3Z_030632 [Daucus carota]
MNMNHRRNFHNFIELVERGSGRIRETRDYFVGCLGPWFYRNYEEIRIWCEKNAAVCLAFIFQLAIVVINSFLLGDEVVVPIWKASWVAGMSIFAIIFLILKIFVEIKRFKLTWWNNTEMWVFIITHVLQFLIPLLYLLLAYAYLTGLDTSSHHMESNWKVIASGIKAFINVIGSLLSLIGAIYYWTPDDHQSIAFPANVGNSTVVDEDVLQAVVPVDAENQPISYAKVEVLVQREEESKPVGVEGPHVAYTDSEVVKMRMDRPFEAANLEVVVQRNVNRVGAHVSQAAVQNNVKNQPTADANLDMVIQGSVKNRPVADVLKNQPWTVRDLENQPGTVGSVENQPSGIANLEVAVKRAGADRHFENAAEVVEQRNVDNEAVAFANLLAVVHIHVENPPVAYANSKVVMRDKPGGSV